MTVVEEVRGRTRRSQPLTRRALCTPRAVERRKLPLDKVHQKEVWKIYVLVVDGGGRGCYSSHLKHERLANVIRTVINLGKWFRAEPCRKHGLGQRGFPPDPPSPKAITVSFPGLPICSRLISFVD